MMLKWVLGVGGLLILLQDQVRTLILSLINIVTPAINDTNINLVGIILILVAIGIKD